MDDDSRRDWRRLLEIDDKLLKDEYVSEDERQERTEILERVKIRISKKESLYPHHKEKDDRKYSVLLAFNEEGVTIKRWNK